MRAAICLLLVSALLVVSGLAGCSLDLARLRVGLDASMADVPLLDAPLQDAPLPDGSADDAPSADAPADGGVELVVDPVTSIDFPATPSNLLVGVDPAGARIVVHLESSGLRTSTLSASGCSFAEANRVDIGGGSRGASALVDVVGTPDLDILTDVTNGSLSVFEQDSAASFAASDPFISGTTGPLLTIAVGDLDGDAAGLRDLVAVERRRFAVPMIRSGDTFLGQSGISSGVGSHLEALVSDVDGMNDDDFVALVEDGASVFLEIQQNQRTMPVGFQQLSSDPLPLAPEQPVALAVGEPNSSSLRPIAVVLGMELHMALLTDPAVSPAITLFGPFPIEAGTTDVAIADVDGDAEEDVVTSSSVGGRGLLTLRHWRGGSMLSAHTSIALPAVPIELVTFDVDGDGTDEVFVLTSNRLLVYSLRCP